jgi:hypothetical protein
VLIGQLECGLTWHRAILFKYFCGLPGVGLDCRLMRAKERTTEQVRMRMKRLVQDKS